ncbi:MULTISPECIES: SRPBCC family protein [Bacillaceae]|uniref:SRPBCC family protein n=1 Tax=Evansella alkalicola TaxID=745819 RepID=A0ABS6JVN3_9BACI|nr:MULTISPECIES: SRPBCC family protein [Bacillaceae]MBU9722638.1 SRPBCC family protein [Bacillus alkalicola]
MADFVEEVVVNSSKDDTYAFLSNPMNRTKIYSIVSEVESLSSGTSPVEEIAVGSRFLEMRQFANRRVGTELELTELVPPYRVTIKSEANGMNVFYTYQLGDSDEGTMIRFEGKVEATKLKTRLMRPALVKMVRQEDSDHLLYVKKALEGDS